MFWFCLKKTYEIIINLFVKVNNNMATDKKMQVS